MALHNHPSIPETTRARVRAVAQELGYVPDPMLSALAQYRHSRRPASYQGTIAWVVNNLPPYAWEEVSMFRDYHEGARSQAALHGYNLDTFDLNDYPDKPERLANIFRSRNIIGLLLCPQPGPNWKLNLPVDDFACITFGYSLRQPLLHTVAPTQFRAMMETMRRLIALGYHRIGFACSFQTDQRTDHNFIGGYFVENFLGQLDMTLPPIDEETTTPESFSRWYNEYKPDAVVTGNPRILDVIRKSGLRVPEDIGVAGPSIPFERGTMSGVYEDSRHIGKTAVDALVGMINRGERGVPERPLYIHAPGVWVDGETLRQQSKEAEPKRVRRKGAKAAKAKR